MKAYDRQSETTVKPAKAKQLITVAQELLLKYASRL